MPLDCGELPVGLRPPTRIGRIDTDFVIADAAGFSTQNQTSAERISIFWVTSERRLDFTVFALIRLICLIRVEAEGRPAVPNINFSN
jgi:hypothetical protein